MVLDQQIDRKAMVGRESSDEVIEPAWHSLKLKWIDRSGEFSGQR